MMAVAVVLGTAVCSPLAVRTGRYASGDPATGQVQALMRVDGSITKFAWVYECSPSADHQACMYSNCSKTPPPLLQSDCSRLLASASSRCLLVHAGSSGLFVVPGLPPDDLMRLGFDVARVSAFHEDFERVPGRRLGHRV